MINQCFRTHFLKFHMEFCTLVNENFNQTPNLLSILFKICHFFIATIQQWHQLQPHGEVFVNQNILIMLHYQTLWACKI